MTAPLHAAHAHERVLALPVSSSTPAELALTPVDLDRLITERAAAAFLNFSVKTVRNWRVTGRGPKFVRASSNAVRYRLRDLMAWSEERLVSSTSEVPGA